MDRTSATKAWIDNWQRVGPLLEKLRDDELRDLSDADAASAFRALAEFAANLPATQPRTTSGFVEQQRLFMKLRKP